MKSFPTKVDTWLAVVLGIAPLVTAITAVVGVLSGQPSMVLSFVVVLAVYAGLVVPIRYEVADEALVIRFGLVRSRIAYASIRRVVPTRNMLSNPALSLDRLHVDSGNPLGPCISPADKAGFLAALAQKTPHLKLEGDSLLPA